MAMSFYTPSNRGPGRTIDTSTAPSAAQPGDTRQNPYGHQDLLLELRGLVDGNTAGNQYGSNAGISWDQLANSRYEDDGLRALRNETSAEDLLNQEYLLKYAAAAKFFYNSLVGHRGALYGEYRNVLEHFRKNKQTGAVCHIRNAFVDKLNQNPILIQYIAKAAIPIFGSTMIEMAKSSTSGNLPESDYRRAASMTSSMVLTMEFISWLTKSPDGREKTLFLTPEIKKIVGDLEKFKDVFTKAAATFGMANPYAGLVFEVSTPISSDSSMVLEAERALRGMNSFAPGAFDTQPISQAGSSSLMDQVLRTASESRNQYVYNQENHSDGFDRHDWETKEVDFSKITKENKDKFDYKALFNWIGKDNWYVIPESDWKRIKHIFKRHQDQPEQEDSVLAGCFRAVKIDLDYDTGWFSTVLRGEGLDMATQFTDPRKLLPALEGVEGTLETRVQQIAAEVALGKGNKTSKIPVGVCEKLEGIPLITVKDQIATKTSKELVTILGTTNGTLTANLKNTNAVAFNTKVYEFFHCVDADERNKLVQTLPWLFKDSEDVRLSFYDRLNKTVNYFDSGDIDDEMVSYVDHRLTLLVNDWLINSLGYSNNPNSEHFLAVESIFEDYRELDEIFKDNDEEAYRCFNMEGTPGNYLTEQMRMFVGDSVLNKEVKTDTLPEKVQKSLRVIVERDMYFTVINHRLPPAGVDNGNDPLVIRRSKFPEFFDLVEKGFEATMGEGKDVKVIDKLLQFDKDDSIWLFSYSSLDCNMASMRRVIPRRGLLMMDLT